MLLLSAVISGLGLGSMYGLLALGFYVTYAVSNTVNFAQGSAMMLGAVLCYTFAVTWKLDMVASAVAAIAVCALWGLVIERWTVRPFARRGSNAWLMATVAAGIVLDNATLFLFGKEPRSLRSSLVDTTIDIGGIGVYPLQLVIPVLALLVACGLHLFSHRTRRGKALLAVVQNPDAARLMGIDVGRVIAGAFAVSAAFAGLGGILIAPLFNVAADMGTLFGIKAFAVAIVGGITSAWGVTLAGLVYGVVEALITSLFGSAYTQILMFSVVILALAVMPNGLFQRRHAVKV
jgi:branched-chain amino acid transport system permease protein